MRGALPIYPFAVVNALTGAAMAVSLLGAPGCSPTAKSASDARDADRERGVAELADAVRVLDEMGDIPAPHRRDARCVAVIPSLVRAGFIVGARHGDGVVSCRAASGWSAPAFITVTGGSAGLQAGVESSDVILLVMSDHAKTQLFRSTFALGADVSASAGPVGVAKEADTDVRMKAEFLSYARSRGLFAGVELSGAVVKQDARALAATYGESAEVHAILEGGVAAPKEAQVFVARLTSAFAVADKAVARGTLDGQRTP